MSPAELNRRALMAGAATAAAIALPATVTADAAIVAGRATAAPAIAAAQSSDTADPIFAALERWQKIDTECDRLLDEESDGGINKSPAAEAAVDAVVEERLLLAETAPTTLAGLAAYVSFLRRQSDEFEVFFFEDDEQLAFIESLDRSLASIVAQEAVRS